MKPLPLAGSSRLNEPAQKKEKGPPPGNKRGPNNNKNNEDGRSEHVLILTT